MAFVPALKPEDLPDIFPVFPLGEALLLPCGHLPLNIFEPRYMAMVEDSLAQGRYFGMVQPDKRLVPGKTGPGLYRIGCLGRITTFEETDDGRYLITLKGVSRFTIVEEISQQRGYRRVRAGLSGFSDDLAPSERPVLPFPRQTLLDTLQRYFAAAKVEPNWTHIETLEDATLLTSLCMACPFTVEEKQALLEAKTPSMRADALRTLLEIHAFGGGPQTPPESSIN